MDSNLTASDVALLNNDGLGGNAFLWIFALLILAGGGFGNMNGNGLTQADLSAGLNAQTTQNQMQSLAVETANNNYETAQLINAQTSAMLQQNNTNLINAIQGFNQVNLNIQNQTNVLAMQLQAMSAMQLQAMSAKMDDCCCSIKTQMLQDRLADSQAQLVAAQNNISNANQSQYLLSQLGKFVPTTGTTA